MTVVRRPSPFGDLVSLRQAMDRLFEDSFVRPRPWAQLFEGAGLPLDVRQTAEELVVQASLPGVKPEDVDITIENGVLTIAAEQHSETRDPTGSYLVQEIRRGSVTRSITLPDSLEPDRAVASFEHGQLTLRIPRAEKVKPRTIRITPTTDGQSRSAGTGAAPTVAGSELATGEQSAGA